MSPGAEQVLLEGGSRTGAHVSISTDGLIRGSDQNIPTENVLG